MKTWLIKIMVAGIILSGVLILFIASVSVPNLSAFESRKVVQSTKIYDHTGEVLLYDVHGSEKRTVITFDSIPRNIKNATIALEDDTFYQHYGIRPLSLLRAFLVNIIHGGAEQGGSTITQQLAKNTLLTPERTIFRKIKELIVALKIERKYSKDQILNFYLNQIPYGNGAYGIEAAAETFFGKHASDLTTKEAAYLASLPKAPSYYSPYGKHKQELDGRTNFTIQRMHDLGFLTDTEYNQAKNEKVKFLPSRTHGIIAPHFVIEIKDQLDSMFGEDAVEQGGYKVTTSLDADLQQKMEEVIEKYAPNIEKNFNAKNAGMVAIDPKTGNILSMVGSRDYFDTAHEGNFNITTAHRQPGSAFKPFVYATAFKRGFTPDTIVFDVPTEFNPLCSADGAPTEGLDPDKCYHPQNFDGKFRGPVTLREALAQSLNVPSVKVLYLAGLIDSLNTARDFGITSLNEPDRYGLTLVLGGGEVSLLELTSAYAVFAADGVKNPYRYILKIEDAGGNVVYQTPNQSQQVIDANIARGISDTLSDNKARAPSFGEFSALYFPNKKVAAKTGTTNDYRDAWVLGYTPDIVIGAWAGNNNNTPMEKKVAGFIVAPMWHEVMDYALTKYPDSDFIQPSAFLEDKPHLRGEWRGGEEYTLDKISGGLATSYTPPETQEKKVVMSVHSILYWMDRKNDSQFKNWEDSVRAWAYKNNFFDETSAVIPKNYDEVHVPANFPNISKINIFPKKDIYQKNETIALRPVIVSKYPLTQIDYFWGDSENYLGSSKNYPYDFIINLKNLDMENQMSSLSIKLKAYDNVSNKTESNITIGISSN